MNTKIEVLCIFGHFGLRDTFQERIAPRSVETDKDKLRVKFSALNVDFDGPSLDFLGSRRPAHEGIKERSPVKVVILPLLVSFCEKPLKIGTGMLPIATSIVTSFLVVLILMTLKDPELPQ